MIRRIAPFVAVLLLLLACLAPLARAEGQWTLTTADFRNGSVTLRSIDAAGVHVVPAGSAGGEGRVVPFDQFLDVSRVLIPGTAASGGPFVLHLLGGDHLGGEPAGMKGNSLVWRSPSVGEVTVPLKQLVAIVRPNQPAPDARRREDVVTMKNGDTLRGIIASFAEGKVSVQADAGPSDVPLASVKEINFAATAGGASAARGFRVRFDDGSSVVAPSVTVTGDKLNLAFANAGGDGHPVDLARVAAIEQVNGPVSWLSARTPAESVYLPFFGTDARFPARMNANYRGETIRVGAQAFPHGIGVHAYSRLAWPLDGSCQAFRTRYAIDTEKANTRADVTVRIKLDDRTVYEQAHVRAGPISPVILEDLKGAKRLTLEVDYGANGDTEDRFNWIEPALLKQMPASETQPGEGKP